MAMTLKEIRQKYPDYDDLSDIELADKIHSKFYSDLPKEKVYENLGVKPMELQLTKAEGGQDEEPDRGTFRNILSVGGDIVGGVGNALKGGAKFVANTPQMMEDLGEELLEHPGTGQLRGLGQIGAEAADIGKGIVNAPYNLNQYLAKKHLLPQVLGKLGKFIPHIPEDTGVEKALGLTPRKGDKLLRGLTEAAGIVAGGAPLAKGVKKLATAPSKEKLFQRALEERIAQAEEKANLSKDQLKSFQDALKKDYSQIHGETLGEANPTALQEKINVAEHKIREKKPLTEIPEQQVGEIPKAPDTKAMIAKHQEAVDAAHEAAESHLGLKENPHISARGKIKKAINEVKSSAENLYKEARNHYATKELKVDNSKEIKELGKEIDQLAANEGVFEGTESEREILKNQIKSLEEEKVNATDLFDIQRTLETMAENTRKKQYAGNVPQLEFKRLGNLAQRLDARAAQLEKRLESVGGKDVQKIMTEANKGWRTYKQLTKENPVGRAAMKGNIPNDSLVKLADEYPANDFLKGLVDSDPELRKNLLAIYTGENSVKSLIKPSTAIKNVLQSLPEVEEHVQALKNAISEFKTGKSDAAKIKAEHKELVDSMKKAAEEQKVRRDAIEESAKLEKQIKFRKEALPKIEEKMKHVDANTAEHKKLQKELADHKKFIEDKGGRLKELAKFFVKVKVAGKIHL